MRRKNGVILSNSFLGGSSGGKEVVVRDGGIDRGSVLGRGRPSGNRGLRAAENDVE